MLGNKKNNSNGWILCPSKSFPGKLYYFNVVNGEAAWSLNEVEKKTLNQDCSIQKVADKSHSFPEPDTPPTDETFTNFGTNICHQQIPNYMANMPSQRFGELVFPKYFSNVAPILFAPVQLFMPPEPNKITKQLKQTSDLNYIVNHSTDISLSKRFSKTFVFENTDHRFSFNQFCETSTPKKQATNLKFNNSLNNDNNIFKYPNISRRSKPRSHSESETSEGPFLFNKNQNSTLSHDNRVYKPYQSAFTQTPTWTVTQSDLAKNSVNKSLVKSFLSKSDESINIVNQKCTLNNSSRDNNGKECMYNKLDSEDLRFVLVAKRRRSLDSGNLSDGKIQKSQTNVNVTPKKKVTFDLQSLDDSRTDDDENCDGVKKDVMNPNIEYLKRLAKPSMYESTWYIVVDTEILLDEYDFIDKYVLSDEKCKLLIPYVVVSDIETMSKGDSCGRHRTIVARQLCRRLAAVGDHVVLQPKIEEDKRIITNSILNCCIETNRVKNRHVILITNDPVLLNKAKTLDIHGFTLQEIKDGVVSPQKVTFDRKNDKNLQKENLFLQNDMKTIKNSTLSFEKLFNSKKIDITDDRLINITKPKNIRQNESSTFNYENEIDCSSEIGRDIMKMDLKDQDLHVRKSLFDEETYTNNNTSKSAKLRLIEEDIKRFFVKNQMMEEKIKLRIDEWICTFSQILEDVFTDILLKKSSHHKLSPPWYLCEAVECIKHIYSNETVIIIFLNKFSLLLFNCCSKKGILKSSMNAKDFIKILGYGITLIHIMQSITPLDELTDAHAKLNSMLHAIEDPNEDIGKDIETPIIRKSDMYDTVPTKRYNFQKTRSDIIQYLQKYFPQWKNYNEETEKLKFDDQTDMNHQNKNTNIVRTVGKNLGLIKINNTKDISIMKPKTGNDKNKTDGQKIVRTLNGVRNSQELKSNDEEPKFLRTQNSEARTDGPKIIRNFENIKDFPLRRCERIGDKQGQKIEFRPDVNIANDLNVPKHGNTFQGQSPKVIRPFENDRQSKNEPKVIINMKLLDTYEEKLMKQSKDRDLDLEDLNYEYDSLSNINNTQHDINSEAKRYLNEEINVAQIDKNSHKDKEIETITNVKEINDNSNAKITSAFFKDTYEHTNNIENTSDLGIVSLKDDLTNDSGFENESLQAYTLAKLFLNEVSTSFKMIYEFIDKSINEVRDEVLQEDKKKILHYKANKTHTHIAQVIEKLKSIIERESNEGTTLKSFFIKAGDASGDKRMSRYRQVVTKSLEQAQMLENALKLMLNIIDEDFSTISSDDCEELKYYNIFE